MHDELCYNRRSRCYEGETSDGKYWVSVSSKAMDEARHSAAMGRSNQIDYLTWIYAPDTWVNDPTLQNTVGVEIAEK